MTRSVQLTVGCAVCLTAWPLDDLAPQRHWMDDRRKANDSLHHIHVSVLLYGWSHFSASIDRGKSPDTDLGSITCTTRIRHDEGVKEPCSIL